MPTLSKNFIDSLTPDGTDKTFWDDEITGFGVRLRGQSKTWILMYRNSYGIKKKLTIGSTKKFTPVEAKKKAKEFLADIVLNGKDPALEKIETRKIMNFADLCDLYILEGTSHKKSSTILNDKSRIECHLKPLIGHLPIKAINASVVDKLKLDIINGKTAKTSTTSKKRGLSIIKGGQSIAKRTLEMLSAIMEFAITRNYINSNPVKQVKKPKTNKREVFLTIDDIKKLGKALNAAQEIQLCNTTAINAIKLLTLTGCRKDEILSLKWSYIDFENQCFRFPDTKTGAQIRAFGLGAKHLLQSIEQTLPHNYNKDSWVFPATRGNGYFIGLLKAFNKICNLPTDYKNEQSEEEKKPFISKDICLHTLRHSFASVGADMNYNELTIAGLLGHKLGGVTNRYSHNVDKSLVYAADKISLRIEQALENKEVTKAEIISIAKGA